MNINTNFCKLRATYLFTEVVNRTKAYEQKHPDKRIIRLGIGDVQGPLAPVVIEALHKAVNDQADTRTFHGYGLEEGPEWLRQRIADFDYKRHNIPMEADEVFISDGAGSDIGNIGDILSQHNRVAIPDPVYPAYVDTNVMDGRAGDWLDDRWSDLIMLPCTPDNDFCPELPEQQADIIYLCSPNNPTGTALNREQLTHWVNYAREHHSLIIFDGAYEAFIQTPNVPHSIYEIEGAREVAIEIRSLSKTAGFTGVRCGYTIVPKALMSTNGQGDPVSLNAMWYRRVCTKYNGTSYISERAAEAVLTDEGYRQTRAQINIYRANAQAIKHGLQAIGMEAYGGQDSPYVWVRVPKGMGSWEFFDLLLDRCQVVCTPGEGFGHWGKGFIRFSGFGNPDNIAEAMQRISTLKL